MGQRRTKYQINVTLMLIEKAKSKNLDLWNALTAFAEKHLRADPDYSPLPRLEAWAHGTEFPETHEAVVEEFEEEHDENDLIFRQLDSDTS